MLIWVLGGWGLFQVVVAAWFLGPVTYMSHTRQERAQRRAARRARRKGESG